MHLVDLSGNIERSFSELSARLVLGTTKSPLDDMNSLYSEAFLDWQPDLS